MKLNERKRASKLNQNAKGKPEYRKGNAKEKCIQTEIAAKREGIIKEVISVITCLNHHFLLLLSLNLLCTEDSI